MDTTPSRDPLPDTDPTAFFPDPTGFETPVFAAPEAEPLPPPPVAAPVEPSTAGGRPTPSRLRVLAAGAAVAGVAATAGLGLYAAAGGSTGPVATSTDPAVTSPAASAPTTATNPGGGGITTAPDGDTVPPDGGRGGHGRGPRDAAGLPATGNPGSGVQPPTGATGPGHAATGGS